jgi:hypothetical protein
LAHNAAAGLAAPIGANPIEGRLLHQSSSGDWHVYHNELEFAIQRADVGDEVIDAIPAASPSQWTDLFTGSPGVRPVRPTGVPEPFPAMHSDSKWPDEQFSYCREAAGDER